MSMADAAFAQLMSGVKMCQGCEDEVIVDLPDSPRYCAFCETLKRVMEQDFAKKKRLDFAALPRTDIGVVPIAELMRPVVRTVERPSSNLHLAELVAVAAVYVGLGAVVFGVVGYYGLRLLCAAGIALAAAVRR